MKTILHQRSQDDTYNAINAFVVISHINMPYSLKALFNYKLMFLEPNGVSLLLNPLF